MENIILFKGIEELGVDKLLGYLQAKPYVFKKNDIIWKKGEKISHIAVILVGGVKIFDEDTKGNEFVYGYAGDNEAFGMNYICSGVKSSPVNVMATKQTGVLFIPYKKIVAYNENLGVWQEKLIKNLFKVVSNENIMMKKRLFFLEKKSIREKVMSLLKFEALKIGKLSFELPLSREDMANYLCVDRSALSRELSNLQKDNLIKYNRNEFTLLE